MRQEGFWSDTHRPEDHLDPTWRGPDRSACLRFIRAGTRTHHYKGWAECRICGEKLGSSDLELPGGHYVCPAMFDHYLRKHRLKPSRRFIDVAVAWGQVHGCAEKKVGQHGLCGVQNS